MGINDRDSLKKLAEIASVQQQLRTGHPPKQVDAAFVGDALVMVLHDALTTVEKKLAQDPKAGDQLQAFHRELFQNSSNTMKHEIARVTGRAVRETVSELETGAGSLVYAPATGVMIQVYMLSPWASPDKKTLDEPLDSSSIERAEDDGLRITPPQDG
jgi:uncharacterized protein YbcI